VRAAEEEIVCEVRCSGTRTQTAPSIGVELCAPRRNVMHGFPAQLKACSVPACSLSRLWSLRVHRLPCCTRRGVPYHATASIMQQHVIFLSSHLILLRAKLPVAVVSNIPFCHPRETDDSRSTHGGES